MPVATTKASFGAKQACLERFVCAVKKFDSTTDRHSKNGLLILPNWVLTFVVAFIKNYL